MVSRLKRYRFDMKTSLANKLATKKKYWVEKLSDDVRPIIEKMIMDAETPSIFSIAREDATSVIEIEEDSVEDLFSEEDGLFSDDELSDFDRELSDDIQITHDDIDAYLNEHASTPFA